MNFTNEQIDTASLPDFTHVNSEKLSLNYLKVIFITRGIIFLILTGGIIVAAYLLKDIPTLYRVLSAAAMITLLIIYFIISPKVFKAKSYAVRQNDIIYTRGLIFKSTSIIPFNRIQHAEIVSGPLDRIYDLATLKIFTAGGNQSDLSIPGLTPEKATKIKSFIISKTEKDEEE